MPASLRVNESDWASGCIALSVILRNGGYWLFQPDNLRPGDMLPRCSMKDFEG